MEERDFLGVPVVKNLPCNLGDTGSIPGQGAKIPPCCGATKPAGHDWRPLEPSPNAVK